MEKERRVGKASAKEIEVMTDSGPIMMKAPSTVKEVRGDKYAEGWLQADRDALHIGILSHAGNCLVPGLRRRGRASAAAPRCTTC